MTPLALEAWAMAVVDQVARGAHAEDARVELKAEWPRDTTAAARILAAHANSARGATILWMIGLDETRGAVGAAQAEVADWYASVASHFDQVPPRLLKDMNVTNGEKTVVALLFETERAPYVVRNAVYGKPGGGSVSLEVPWREGRATRSARRQDLVRMLAPIAVLPQIEVLEFRLSGVIERTITNDPVPALYLYGGLYVLPQGEQPVVIPFHRCAFSMRFGTVEVADWSLRLEAPGSYQFTGGSVQSQRDSLSVQTTSSEVVITGPGKLGIRCSTKFDATSTAPGADVGATLHMHVVGALAPVVLQVLMSSAPANPDESCAWHARSAA